MDKTILKYCIVFFSVLFCFSTSVKSQDVDSYELVSVHFEGNNSISTEVLESVIVSKESPGWFSQFLDSWTGFGEEAIYFDSLLIPTDIIALRSLYQASGFFKYKIDASYILDFVDKEAELIFTVNEGEPATFREFNVLGLDNLQQLYQSDILNSIEIDTTEIFSNSEVERNVDIILTFLRDDGFVFSQAGGPVVYIDTLLNRADVEVVVEPGEKYSISEVRVQTTGEGRENVEDNLIREIVGIDSGDVYSYIDMRRGQIRLYRTNLFSSVLVTAITSDTLNNTIPIGINADVGKIHEISPEILVNDEDNTFNFGFGVGFTKKNFFGDARKISLNLSTAAQNVTEFITNPSITDTTLFGYADARIIMEQPFIFGLPIDTKLETYYTLQKRKNEYNAILYGMNLGFDFELPPYTYFNSFSTYFNIENSQYKFRESYISEREQSSKILLAEQGLDTTQVINIPDVSENVNAVLGIVLGANKTNDFLFPTSGYNLFLSIEDGNALAYGISQMVGIKFNDPLYYRAVANYSLYLPLAQNQKSALAFKIKTGYIRSYKGNQFDIPLNQRFYVGGSNSVRGWSTRELVPELTTITLPENPTSEEIDAILARGIIPGGFFMLEGSIEARTRLIGALGSAVFVDYGNSWNSYTQVTWKSIAIALGAGLRYYSDIVPIRIDFGVKLYDPSNRISPFSRKFGDVFQFHLGIGEAF